MKNKLIAMVLLSSQSAMAREFYDLFATPYGRSMGGAVSALVDDSNSLFYNPAGLAMIQNSEMRFPDLIMGYGSPAIKDVLTQIQGLGSGGGGTSSLTTTLSALDRVGASAGLGLLGLGWFQPKMGIHWNLLNANLSFRVRTPSLLFSKIKARLTADSAVSLGFARSFFDNTLRIGTTIRPFHLRGGFDKNYEGLEILQLQDVSSLLGVGWGFDADIGMQAHTDRFKILEFPIRISAGWVFQNLLENDFSKRLTSTVEYSPPGTERRMNLGFGVSVLGMQKFRPSASLEFRDVLVDTDSWLEFVSAAVEFKFMPKTWFHSIIRGHFYKGNLGGGIGGKLWFGELEIGTYAVNLGRGLGVGVDRRLYAQLSSVF